MVKNANEQNKIIPDTVISNRVLNKKREVTKSVILVGGWGTRLRPLTYTKPKPLVPFCNMPMLEHIIRKLSNIGIKEIILAVNYYSEQIINECRIYEKKYKVELIYSKEDDPLGTGGAIANAKEYLIGSSFFVFNSDICADIDLEKMKIEFQNSSGIGTVCSYSVNDPTRYGLLDIDQNRIRRFIEKPNLKDIKEKKKILMDAMENNGSEYCWNVNAGVYILTDEIFSYLEKRNMSIETDFFPSVSSLGLINSFRHTGYWKDIGQIGDYINGQKLYLESIWKIKGEDNKDISYETCKYRSELMIVSKNVVIGRNVEIGRNVHLENCAIFDGAFIGDNTIIKSSIIGWGCRVNNNCEIYEGSVLGKDVVVEPKTLLKFGKIGPVRI